MSYSIFREAAESIVLEARERLLNQAAAGFSIEKKPDQSFVTAVDLETEKFIRSALQKAFPDHNILGEEFPSINQGSEFTWVIDPIDGTQSFRLGIPLYGILLCLMKEENPIAAVIDLPALGKLYSASAGEGAFRNNEPIQLTDVAPEDIPDEVIATGERMQFVKTGDEAFFDRLMTTHDHVRTYCDCFGHALAAEGSVGAMVDFGIRLWDGAAGSLIVKEAGGKVVCTNVHTRADGSKRYDWVMGKPAVVDWILSVAGDS